MTLSDLNKCIIYRLSSNSVVRIVSTWKRRKLLVRDIYRNLVYLNIRFARLTIDMSEVYKTKCSLAKKKEQSTELIVKFASDVDGTILLINDALRNLAAIPHVDQFYNGLVTVCATVTAHTLDCIKMMTAMNRRAR